VLTEMSAENNQESVVAEEVFVRTTLAVTIVSVLVDTEWTKEETSASTLMNAVEVQVPDHAVETARTYQAHSDVTVDKDTLQQCLDVDVRMLMNVLVAEETHVDQTNNVKTLQEASNVVAIVDSVWNHKAAVVVMLMNVHWEEEVALLVAQIHMVDSNALAQWDSSDWDLDIVFVEVQVDSDNKFLVTEVASVVALVVVSELVINNHKPDGLSLKPDVSVVCQVEIPREVNDQPVMPQQLDLLRLMTTKEGLKLTLHIQSKLNSTFLKESHIELSSHSDHR